MAPDPNRLSAPQTPQDAPNRAEQPEQPVNAGEIQESTQASIAHVLSGEFQSASTYEERLRVIDKVVPPLHPADATAFLFSLEDSGREKGLVYKILDKVEAAIGGEQAEKDGVGIFEKVLTTADTQLAFVAKLHSENLENHIGPLLKHAATDEVRIKLIEKMKGRFPSDEALLEAIKDADGKETVRKLLGKVPKGGMSDETARTIEEEKLGMRVDSMAKSETQEAYTQSVPDRKVSGFFGSIWNGLKNFWGGFKNLFSFSKKTPPTPPEEPPAA